jgi:TPR repeat protein
LEGAIAAGQSQYTVSGETANDRLETETKQDHSIIVRQPFELGPRRLAENATLGKMVVASLGLARRAALESDDFDTVVRQALRIQDGAQGMAFQLLHRAATAGHAEAQFQLFRCYWNGSSVQQDRGKSFEWLHRSAESGFAQAQNELGCHCLLSGKLSEAVKWFEKSAQQGDSYGEWSLGCCYADGKGVTEDHAKALKWFRKAAKRGLAWAQNELGFCYLVGRGVRKNIFQALRWYRRAAEGGNAGGQYGLGRCYQLGLGVLQDSLQAFKWLRLAADQDHERAKEEITALATQMSSVQLRAARALYEEFKMNKASSDGGDVGMK